MFETVSGDTRIAWIVVAVGTALLAVVVWRATRGWNTDRTIASVPEAVPARSAREWTAESEEHAAAGRWREAVRARYAALVVTLVESGTLADVPGRTVRELDHEVARAAPALEAAARRAGETFEDVWYGHGAAGAEQLGIVAAALDEVAGAVRRGREVRV